MRQLAWQHAAEAARFVEPHGARGQLPTALAGEGSVPTYRFVVDVHCLVVGVEQLNAMPVGIAHVDEQRVTGAVAARSVLNVLSKSHVESEIADIEEVIRLRDAKRRVVQPRPGAGRKHDVVWIALSLQEDEYWIVRTVRC